MADCIEWTKARSEAGYGVFTKQGRLFYAHRVAWAEANGVDPVEMTRDMIIRHSCDNPGCVNPEHLSLGTQSDNMQECHDRGRANNANAVKTHCVRGHEFTPENTYIYVYPDRAGPTRRCKTCTRLRKKAYKERNRNA